MVKDNPSALYLFDQELAKRVCVEDKMKNCFKSGFLFEKIGKPTWKLGIKKNQT